MPQVIRVQIGFNGVTMLNGTLSLPEAGPSPDEILRRLNTLVTPARQHHNVDLSFALEEEQDSLQVTELKGQVKALEESLESMKKVDADIREKPAKKKAAPKKKKAAPKKKKAE